jgi:hypothetical protein
VRAPGALAARSPHQVRARDGAVARTSAVRLCFAGNKVLPVSTEKAPGRCWAWSQGTELTRKGSSMVRRLSGRDTAALQQRGSSSGRRQGPSGPVAGGEEGVM